MTETPIRVGIVGCASMGRSHAEALADIDGAELVGCADHTPETAQSFGETHGCPSYTSHADLFADAALDAVCVCTPNGAHRDIVVDAAAAGIDVLCEKPLEITPGRVDDMVVACRDAGVTLACILQRRLFPTMQFAREVVGDGRLGRLVFADVRVKWHRDRSYYDDSSWHGSANLDGGVLFTQALHGIDLLQWVAGDVSRVAGTGDALYHDIEAPDTAALSLRFEDGALGQVSATTATRPQQAISLEFNGTEGTLRVTETGVELFEVNGEKQPVELPDPRPDGPHVAQIRDFVEAVSEGRPPMVPPDEARKGVDIVFAAERSDSRGEWVSVSSVGDLRDADD
ncbi:Gfo/Idh/MocA family protein [Haloferax sp. Q22]|uniref:Gfo/Idh/MocA family protein n=1 Tax=Haloferax sp. (strain Q22) TaxID=1526048 RepID=UPI000737B94A|nr:Gfo/Idh/MocA family oxidoreductase [Haloferax sp. Q22]